ncbi:hypothetical protein HDA32_005293 [Spinactinospora alkalitolerans]|uniref:Uncharacterized protein n=1 Tax=Spinactinospora alkalitolerans TaxID=687207 RepID=A0A852U5M1_9ACTN|nr:hypothetical protein [Spinactinospora alkalitolerans]NYE50173.1 hypothetical protein [Spinactinospora alkalitolerans]
MNVPARLAGYGAGLVLVFGAAFGLGQVVEPALPAAPAGAGSDSPGPVTEDGGGPAPARGAEHGDPGQEH